MASYGAALGLALAGGMAEGYARERQTQADHRRRMAELSYRSQLGQMNRSMEQTNREQSAMFPPLWTGDRYIKKGEEGYDELWDYRKKNPQSGTSGATSGRQVDLNEPVPPGYKIPPTTSTASPEPESGAFDVTGILGGLLRQPDLPSNEAHPRIDPEIVDAWLANIEFDPDMEQAVSAIKDRIKTARRIRDDWRRNNKTKSTYPYDITSKEELEDFLKRDSESSSPQSGSLEGEGRMIMPTDLIGMGGDISGRGTGEPVKLDSGEIVLDTKLDELDPMTLEARNSMRRPQRGRFA